MKRLIMGNELEAGEREFVYSYLVGAMYSPREGKRDGKVIAW